VQVDLANNASLLQSGRRTIPLALGKIAVIDGSSVTLERIGYAPLFILQQPGRGVGGSLCQTPCLLCEDNFFQFRVLPHRFYFISPEGNQASWKKESNGSWTKRKELPMGQFLRGRTVHSS